MLTACSRGLPPHGLADPLGAEDKAALGLQFVKGGQDRGGLARSRFRPERGLLVAHDAIDRLDLFRE